jgi:hypothetical protein
VSDGAEDGLLRSEYMELEGRYETDFVETARFLVRG